MSIKKVRIPKYSLGEEISNAISHGLGAIFGLISLILMLIKVIPTNDFYKIFSASIYGSSLIILFTISCLYHSLKKNNAKRIMRIIDHVTIYFLLAGSYTPYTLVTMREQNIWGWGNGTVGYIMLGFVWFTCIIGIIFNVINVDKYAWISMICYLLAGWIIVLALVALWPILGNIGASLLLSSGIVYTVGAVIYGFGHKIKYFHTIFHIFVLIGAILMFVSIYCFVY